MQLVHSFLVMLYIRLCFLYPLTFYGPEWRRSGELSRLMMLLMDSELEVGYNWRGKDFAVTLSTSNCVNFSYELMNCIISIFPLLFNKLKTLSYRTAKYQIKKNPPFSPPSSSWKPAWLYLMAISMTLTMLTMPHVNGIKSDFSFDDLLVYVVRFSVPLYLALLSTNICWHFFFILFLFLFLFL